MTDALETAIDLFRMGFPVMPVEGSKAPLVKWKPYQTQLPPARFLNAWARQWPDANWGLITGEFAGLFIAETDNQEACEWMEREVGILGPVARSSGYYKRHYYFRHPGFEVKTCAGEMRPGLDIRGEGGYVVLPGSYHKTGVQYKWLVSPREAPLPDAPEWFLKQLPRRLEPVSLVVPRLPPPTLSSRLEKWAAKVLEKRLEVVSQASPGTLHATLLRQVLFVAGYIPYGLLSEGQVRGEFFNAVQGRARDKRHALHTIDQQIRRGIARPSKLPNWAL